MLSSLSYLMGASEIQDQELEALNVEIAGVSKSGARKLIIPNDQIQEYFKIVKAKLDKGFWNEVVEKDKVTFLFKFNDGEVNEYTLNPQNEEEISHLCSEFNSDPLEKTANVYRYLSENDFYHNFIVAHYSKFIDR
jgi:hypothetical protein